MSRRTQKKIVITITKEQAKAAVRAYLVICLLGVPLALLGVGTSHKPKEAKWQTCMNGARAHTVDEKYVVTLPRGCK